jgi:radical SAM superfamily enzyme YgiQ (UPF0313 family)
MKVLVLNPPFLPKYSRGQRSPAVTKSGTLYYPIWLSYATGVLEQAGHDVKFLDAPADDLTHEDVLKICQEFQPKLLVLETSTGSVYRDVEVGAALKKALPGSYLVMVGTHSSALPVETLELHPAIDATTRGEYDNTLVDLAKVLEHGGSLRDVAGLVLRENGSFIQNADRTFIAEMDSLPFVSDIYRRHLNVRKYFNPNSLYPMVMMITGRGCKYHCTFCMFPQTLHGHAYRLRSVKNVVDEFEYVKKYMPEVRAVFFEDDTLTTSKERCVELSEEILRRNVKISWTANARANVDYETLRIMKKAGLRTLCVGFESGDQQVLNNAKKGMKVERFKDFADAAKRAGVLVHGCFMAGLPGETRETLQKTLDLAKELNPDTAQFYPLMVYPGTEAYSWYEKNGGLVTKDFSKWLTEEGLHNTVIKLKDMTTEELVEWCDDARREFYMRPTYLASKVWQMARHPSEIRRKLKGARTFVRYLYEGSFPKRIRSTTEPAVQ